MSQPPNMEEILIDYLDGTLDATRRRAVETLLKHDAKMRKALSVMRQVRGALGDLPIEPMPAPAAIALQEQLRPPTEPSIPLYSPKWLIRLAAAFAIAVTAGLIIWSVLPPPMDQRTVAMNSVSSLAARSVAFDTKKDSSVAKLGDTMEPSLATRAGGPEQLRADDAASENEPTLMVVVANDIGGTEREIRNLLTLNNINYESVPASVAERVEVAKEVQTPGGGFASDAAMGAAAPAPAALQADKEKSEEKMARSASEAPAAAAPSAVAAGPAPAGHVTPSPVPTPLAPSARAAGAGGGGQGMGGGSRRDTAQALASAKPIAQQFGAATEKRSQTGGGRTASEPYGMVVARNVTPDQLGKIRSGLQNASRAGNLRVVDPSANRVTQAQTYRKQAPDRSEQTNLNQRQVQKQSPWQYSNSQAIQNSQELAQNTTQPPISYSPRYDVTIVVQGEGAAAASIPTWPAPATTSNSTLPSTNPAP